MPYFGSKQRIAGRIVALFPPHRHYVEPYAGSLSVLLAKPPSKLETVNDLDGDLVTFWRVLRDRPEDLMRVCALTPHSRAEQQESYEPATEDLERARRVWVRLSQGRSNQMTRTGWRHYVDPAGTSIGVPGYLDGYINRMAAAAERMHRVSLECRPALEVIDTYGHGGSDVLLYLDPPYLGEVRGGKNSTTSYTHEMKSADQHQELLEALRGLSASIVLSGYTHPLYEAWLSPWHRTEFSAFTGTGNHATAASGQRTEVVWTNFEPHPNLFTAGA
jgi:DNA adenine methylase